MKATALKFVRFDQIESNLRQGWMVMIPNSPSHHNHYGVELKWICNCPIPSEVTELRCSHCGQPHDRTGQRYCRACHALYMRSWRERHVFVSRETVTHRVSATYNQEDADERRSIHRSQ